MPAHERATSDGGTRYDGVVPVLQARPGGPAERFAGSLRGRHPAAVFFAAAARAASRCWRASGDRCSGCSSPTCWSTRGGLGGADESAVASTRRRAHAVPHRRLVRSARRSAARRVLPILVGLDRDRLRVHAQVADRRVRRLRARGRVGDLPRDLDRRPARAARRARGWRTCPPTRATRPATPPRRSPSTPASCCCSRRAFQEPRRADRAWVARDPAADRRRAVAHVPRHAPPARRRRRRSLVGHRRAARAAVRVPRGRRRARERARERAGAAARAVERTAGGMKVAVVAHAGKTLGGGLPELRRALGRGRRRGPALVRGAEGQAGAGAGRARARRGRRARLRLGRRRHRAALRRRARRHRRRPRGRPGRDGEPVRDEPRHPARHRARGRDRAARRRRRTLDVGRFEQGALRRDGRRRLRRRR